MIMCNAGMVPLTRNLFSPCNNRRWSSSLWGCRPGHCNPAIYKEACWSGGGHGHHHHHHHHGKRAAEAEVTFEKEEDEEEQRGLFDRWIAPPPPPPPPPMHYIECSLSCHYGYKPIKSIHYKCDPRDGSFAPALKGCYNPNKKKEVKTVKTTCLCCDVKCDDWHQGGGQAKCAKGYWFQLDTCDKYGMCGKPSNPPNGEYTCLYEHEYGYMNRKRRETDSPDYDRQAPESDRMEDMFSGPLEHKQNIKNMQDQKDESTSTEVSGYRWEQVKQKKMICNLACAPGHVPVKSQAVCIDGNWVVKPSYCKPVHKCSAPASTENGIWECRVEKYPVGSTPGMHSHGHGRKRREDGQPIISSYVPVTPDFDIDNFPELHQSYIPSGQEGEEGGLDRWEEMQMQRFLVCKLTCKSGCFHKGSTVAKCNLDTGFWHPSPGQCTPFIGGTTCQAPQTNQGEYNCYSISGSSGRKRRDTSEAETFEDVWQDKKANIGRWGQSFMICDLTCNSSHAPQNGKYVAKCDQSNGKWIVPPTQCIPSNYTPHCQQKIVNGGVINCEAKERGKIRYDCKLTCFDGFQPIDPNKVNYTCTSKHNTFSPRPTGCKAKTIPSPPDGCKKPPMENGNWKCYRQAVDVPYPPYERTLNWDSIPDQARKRRDAEFETPQNPETSSNLGRWSGGKKPQNLICLVKCQKGYTLSGNYIGVCRENTQQWIVPPVAFCNERPKKTKNVQKTRR